MRLAAFEDSVYRRDPGGVISIDRAFPTFMAGLAADVDHLVVLGRLNPEAGRSHYALAAELDFVALPFYGSLNDPLGVAKAFSRSLRVFWRVLGRVDAIWINGPHPLGAVVALMALARRATPILGVRQNTMLYGKSRHPGSRPHLAVFALLEGTWRALARVCPVVVVGPELAGLYRRHARELHELSVSFVSEDDILPASAASERDWSGELLAVSVGRLEQEKNPLLLADVLAALPERWKLVVCGEGNLRGALEARLDELGVRDRAELLGYVPIDRGLFDVYRRSHAFLHISWTEGLPQVLLEAFAARLPVVATDVGGVSAVAGDAALLVGPGDAQAPAAALERLAAEPELRDRLASDGVTRVASRTAEAQRRGLAAFIARVSGSGR